VDTGAADVAAIDYDRWNTHMPARATLPGRPAKKHVILFLAANPDGTDRLALDREARAIHVELKLSGHRDRFDFQTRWAAEPLDLLRDLRELKPTVVHFSGHGSARSRQLVSSMNSRHVVAADTSSRVSEAGLHLQDSTGAAHVISAQAIAHALGAAGASVKLVVLNACYTAPMAEALLEYVDCVVGMTGAIHDGAARSFAIGFYGGLGDHESVTAAFKQGRAAIDLVGLGDADRPQLMVRAGFNAAQLILAAVTPSVVAPINTTTQQCDRDLTVEVPTPITEGLTVTTVKSGTMVASRLKPDSEVRVFDLGRIIPYLFLVISVAVIVLGKCSEDRRVPTNDVKLVSTTPHVSPSVVETRAPQPREMSAPQPKEVPAPLINPLLSAASELQPKKRVFPPSSRRIPTIHQCTRVGSRQKETANRASCPILSIDDAQVSYGGSQVSVDVRLRNSSQRIVNITRAMLEVVKYDPKPQHSSSTSTSTGIGTASAYGPAHTYSIDLRFGANEFSIAHYLTPESVESFKIQGRILPPADFRQLILMYNGKCRACFDFDQDRYSVP
jgi:hypothetical protein